MPDSHDEGLSPVTQDRNLTSPRPLVEAGFVDPLSGGYQPRSSPGCDVPGGGTAQWVICEGDWSECCDEDSIQVTTISLL